MSSASRLRFLSLLAVLFGASGTAHAQFGGLNAEFAGGGARALAMGGAFIALADDATASEFNPAGLWQLRRPEFAFQGLYTWDERTVPLLGKTLNEFFDQGVVTPFFAHDEENYFVPSFASFVYPTQYYVIGVSEFTNIFSESAYEDEELLTRETVSIREETANYALGLTLATQLAERLSFGTTLRYNFFRYEFERAGTSYDFTDEAPSINFGVLWAPHRLLQLGAVYKSTQELEGTYAGNSVDTRLPDTLGVGLAFLPNDRWRIAFDVDRVWWSKFDPDSGGGVTDPDFFKEDVWRYHAGSEVYVGHWRETSFFLRGGYMYEESNATQARGSDPFWLALAPEPDSVDHYTFGVGMARRRYQLDLGVDLTEENGIDMIVSGVWYF
jgi:long-subunit fatty acid transport protein